MDATHLKVSGLTCSLRLGYGSICRLVGRTKGGLNSKLHVVTDTCGRPILKILTAGQGNDCTGAKTLLPWLPVGAKVLVADRDYDADWIRKVLKEKGIDHCIPSLRNWKEPIPHVAEVCESRYVIENSFACLKRWHQVASRYDRCQNVYLSASALATLVSF